jgi:hypothetical protein
MLLTVIEVKTTDKELILLINSLTSNRDYQQELWIHYLSGNSISSFAQKLEEIKYEHEEHQRIADIVSHLLSNSEPEFKQLIGDFSEFEQSIMCLLAIGLSIPEISKYKKLSIIRVQQVVMTIKNHSKWDKKWLSKDTSQKKKNTDLPKKKSV